MTYQTSKCASGELGSGCSVWSKGKVPSNMTMSNTPPAHTSTSFPSYPIGFPSPPVGWLRLFMSSGDMYTGVLQQQAYLMQPRHSTSFTLPRHTQAGPFLACSRWPWGVCSGTPDCTEYKLVSANVSVAVHSGASMMSGLCRPPYPMWVNI